MKILSAFILCAFSFTASQALAAKKKPAATNLHARAHVSNSKKVSSTKDTKTSKKQAKTTKSTIRQSKKQDELAKKNAKRYGKYTVKKPNYRIGPHRLPSVGYRATEGVDYKNLPPLPAGDGLPGSTVGRAHLSPPPLQNDWGARGPAVIYRQVRPDGSIIYSDALVPGLRIEKKFVEVPNDGETHLVGGSPTPNSDGEKIGNIRPMEIAQKNLQSALSAQQAGISPLEEERSKTLFGGSRLNDKYEERQRILQKNVDDAREEIKRLELAPH